MRTRSRTLRVNQSNRPGVELRPRNPSITLRKRLSSKSHCSHSASSVIKINTESSSPSNPKNNIPKKPTQNNRHRYTDAEDFAILDYVITQNLIKKIRRLSTWRSLETSGILPHSADSMRFRFFNSIIYHFSEVLHCTSEGKAKYSDSAKVMKLHSELLASSQSLKRKLTDSSPLALSDLSYFTSDESSHDDSKIKSKSLSPKEKSTSSSPRNSPLQQLPIRLVDYEDTQSNQSSLKEIPKTPVRCAKPFISRKLSLSIPSERKKSLRPRRRLFSYRDDSDDDVVLITESPSRSSARIKRQMIPKTGASTQSPYTQLLQSKETDGQNVGEEYDEEFFSVGSDTSKKPKRRRVSFESDKVNLNKSKSLSPSKCASVERVTATSNVEVVPDTFSESILACPLLISGSREQSHSSQRLSDASNSDSSKFLLMPAKPRVSNDVLLSRTVHFTRQLDSFARHHQITSKDAALLLHASSGDFELASNYLKTSGRHALWFPRDDSHLLSTSVSDVRTLISKFGQAEVSRRLIYLSDQSLLS
nr:Homeodomain [Hymenolepis microstoma]